MKKKLTALVLTVATAMTVLYGCGGSSGGTEQPAAKGGETQATEAQPQKTEAAEAGDQKIGVLIFNYANDYISYVRKGLEAAAQTAGVEYLTVDGANDQAKQTEQVDTMIQKKVDGLCVALVESTAAETIIEKCRTADLPVVFVNKKPTAEVLNTYDKCWYVGCATQQPGEFQAEMMLEDWKADPTMDKNGDGKIQYVIIKGENGHENAEARIVGIHKVLEESGIEVEELDCQVAGWDASKAKDIMDTWLSKYGDDIEVILSNNDAMALGAIESLKAAGYFEGDKQIAVYGINAIQTGLEALEQGYLRGTIMTDMISEGTTTFQVMKNALDGVDCQTDIAYPYEAESKFFYIATVKIRMDNIDTAWAMYQ